MCPLLLLPAAACGGEASAAVSSVRVSSRSSAGFPLLSCGISARPVQKNERSVRVLVPPRAHSCLDSFPRPCSGAPWRVWLPLRPRSGGSQRLRWLGFTGRRGRGRSHRPGLQPPLKPPLDTLIHLMGVDGVHAPAARWGCRGPAHVIALIAIDGQAALRSTGADPSGRGQQRCHTAVVRAWGLMGVSLWVW